MTLTVYDDIEQRSDEWRSLRCGMITASNVGQLVTSTTLGASAFTCPACAAIALEPCKSKRSGQPIATLHSERAEAARDANVTTLVLADNETTRNLAALLAAERVAGIDPDGELGGRDIWRGVDSEPYAREKYAEHYDVTVTECGFMEYVGDGYKIGFSPDGLVGDDGLLEIKAPRQKGHLLTVLGGEVPPQHIAQIQTGLLVSGRAWCDFVSFKGGMRLWVTRVYPDPDWQRAIHAAVAEFQKTVAQMVTDYYAATADFPATDPLPDFNEVDLKL